MSVDVADALAVVSPGEPRYHITEHDTALALLAVSVPAAEVARVLDMSRETVSRLLKRPEIRAEMARLERENAAEMESYIGQARALLSDALEAVGDVLKNPKSLPADIIRAAAFLADRVGMPKVTKAEVSIRKATMSGQEILECQKRAIEAQREGRAMACVEVYTDVSGEGRT